MSAKDDKWKPAKVIGINENGPRSYNIVTPQRKHHRRNRKGLRRLTPPANIDTSIDIDYQEYDGDTSETLAEPPRAQPPTALNTALQRSQRTIRAPVQYADEFS